MKHVTGVFSAVKLRTVKCCIQYFVDADGSVMFATSMPDNKFISLGNTRAVELYVNS